MATAVSALVIAYQSWQTRRAADAAKDTLAVAEDERDANRRALDISQTLAVEAAMQRRDARARPLLIEVMGRVAVFHPGNHRDEALLRDGAEFHLPRDANQRIGVRHAVTLASGDGAPLLVTPWPNLELKGRPLVAPGSEQALPADSPVPALIETIRTVQEWVEIAETWEAGGAIDHDVSGVRVADAYDDGTIDGYEIWVSGSVLRAAPDRQGVWVLDTGLSEWGSPRIAAQVQPLARRYYISKSQNLELTSPTKTADDATS